MLEIKVVICKAAWLAPPGASMLYPTELTLANKKLVCFVIERKYFSFMLETSKIVDLGSRI
jgi:hypothetical protein